MYEIFLFSEDEAHRAFLPPLVQRIADDLGLRIGLRIQDALGGHGAVLTELERFVKALRRGKGLWPHVLIVATDANCRGWEARKREVLSIVQEFQQSVVCAAPDPHIERWMLLDSRSFKSAVGRSCDPPDLKCMKDRYKKFLKEAVRDAGQTPLFGGMEYADDIVREMDLRRVTRTDDSLRVFLEDLRAALKRAERSG